MTAEFPEKITTQLKTAVNNLLMTLTDDVGENDTEINVQSTSGAPASGSFHIENEIIFYDSKTSLKFTECTRGADGTTKAVHTKTAEGGEIKFGPEAHFINTPNEEIIAAQTKVGKDSDTNTDSHDYKLSSVLAGEKVVSISGEQTLTNKRITKKATAIASHPTPTPDASYDIYTFTAQAEAATFGAPTGTPTQGQTLLIRIKDNGTARALSWNAIYRAGTDIALPTTTVISKTMYVLFIYNSNDTKWDLVDYIDNI